MTTRRLLTGWSRPGADDIRRRLAVLEREIEEHRRWLREDPLLHRHTGQAA